MNRKLAILLLAIAPIGETLAAQMGVASVPLAEIDSDETAVLAIKNSLDSDQSSCTVTLGARGKLKVDGPSGTTEKLSAEVCGKKHRFEIKRIRLPDRAMVTAKRI
jgi:hypothetical protein